MEPVENPETGEKVYPHWDAAGNALNANGTRADGKHVCTGDPGECEVPAVCETCGLVATPETPVTVTPQPDVDTFLCVEHVDAP